MGRLIDADDLIKKFRYADANTEEENIMCATVRRMIKEQPTAYDPDRVIEQLQLLSDKADDDIAVCEKDMCQYYDGYGDGLEKAIEIVKRRWNEK